MARITWDAVGDRFFYYGVDRGVLYSKDGRGIPWNGLTAINENEDDFDTIIRYQDGRARRRGQRLGTYSATLEAFTYPDSFQPGVPFHLSYRTLVGNDISQDFGYRIHIVYNVLAESSDNNYVTMGDDISPVNFSFNLTTTPRPFSKYCASSHVIVDSRYVHEETLAELEDFIYGKDGSDPTLPTIDDISTIFDNNAVLIITDNGDGTWTAEGPNSMIQMLDETTFEIDSPSGVYVSPTTYTIQSW